MLVAGFRPPTPVSSRAASFLLWASIVFIQRVSWPQSLGKANDLRISCSQNAEIQKIGHRNQKLSKAFGKPKCFLFILPLRWDILQNYEINVLVCYKF